MCRVGASDLWKQELWNAWRFHLSPGKTDAGREVRVEKRLQRSHVTSCVRDGVCYCHPWKRVQFHDSLTKDSISALDSPSKHSHVTADSDMQ